MIGSGCFSAPTGEIVECRDVSSFINSRGQILVVPAFGEPNHLILIASDRSSASLVDHKKNAVDTTEFA